MAISMQTKNNLMSTYGKHIISKLYINQNFQATPNTKK